MGNKDKEQSKRVVVDFTTIDSKLKFTLGKVLHNKASLPLEEHVHKSSIEISYFIKGNQVYTVQGKPYIIQSNDVFITFPGEWHGSGRYQKDKSSLYYVQIDLGMFNVIGLDIDNGQELLKQFLKIEKRCFKASKRVESLLDNMFIEVQNPTEFSNILLRSYISEFIVEILKGESRTNEKLNEGIDSVIEYIESHLDNYIKISDLSELMNISEGRFKILFKDTVGIPPKEYILRQKIKVAKELLSNTNDSITQIAYNLGFSNSQYFTTVFKRFNIQSPKEYREESKTSRF